MKPFNIFFEATAQESIDRLKRERAQLEAEWDELDKVPQLHWKKIKIEKRLRRIQSFIDLYSTVL